MQGLSLAKISFFLSTCYEERQADGHHIITLSSILLVATREINPSDSPSPLQEINPILGLTFNNCHP